MALISIPCSRPGLPRRYFPASAHFQAENKKPTIYFWRIADNGGLPPPGEYCLNDYLGDIYLGGVQAMRFSVSGLCIQVKSPTCKITDDSKNINVFLGRQQQNRIYRAQQHHRPGSF
ncbi:hypothetical protein LN650_24445 [Klebsiella pneumoniae subsp. pneumoniae]|nr:hypothetical protein [Klebsiella pneumoniae subsp. pneumoniae]